MMKRTRSRSGSGGSGGCARSGAVTIDDQRGVGSFSESIGVAGVVVDVVDVVVKVIG